MTPLIPLHIGGYDVSFTNQALVRCVIVGLISLFTVMALTKRQLVPGRMQSIAELTYEFVGNMIHSSAGDAGYRFFPFVFTIFVLVLFANVMGLIPGVFTVTSQIAVT
ncbi:MAG: F0F1 ATP synthase subunit A, partial [Alphaproteobacteria bacterium]|nr:F0F1 ATP synthase subunit A [Alphaproteobacteria bacterium]